MAMVRRHALEGRGGFKTRPYTPWGILGARSPRTRVSLDLGFAELDVLLCHRIVFLLGELVGHRARILLGHVIETGIGARHQLDFDRGGLCHREPRLSL